MTITRVFCKTNVINNLSLDHVVSYINRFNFHFLRKKNVLATDITNLRLPTNSNQLIRNFDYIKILFNIMKQPHPVYLSDGLALSCSTYSKKEEKIKVEEINSR